MKEELLRNQKIRREGKEADKAFLKAIEADCKALLQQDKQERFEAAMKTSK